MPAELPALLARQLHRLGLSQTTAPDLDSFNALLKRVGEVYADVDQERYLLERSQQIASAEMATLNKALMASQARLASLLSLSTDWVWEKNAKGRFTYVSDELTQRTGLDNVILLGQACSVEGPLRSSHEDVDRLRSLMDRHQPFHDIIFEVMAADGRVCHMRISGEPVFLEDQFRGYRGVGQDVSAAVEADRRTRETARRKLEAQLDFTSRLLEVNPTPLFVKDEMLRFVMVNPAWSDLMDLTAGQVIGKTSLALFGPESPVDSEQDERLLDTEDRIRYENRLERPGRVPRDTVVTKVRFSNDDGTPAGIIGSVVDVTEFREAERATREARDAAETANRAKSEFIANISHELRTPLQSIVGFSELGAVRATDNPRWQELFKDIQAGGQRMLTLVNELLDLSKAGDMSASLDIRPHDLLAITSEVGKELWPLASKRSVRIRISHGPGPLTADVDAFRIQQVVRNVLANALRFAPADSVIEVDCRNLADAGSEIVIRDYGPGIPAGELELIFDPFVQSSRTRDGSGGTGLGLTICRKIMNAHGGSITAENAQGGGAKMTLRLPVGANPAALPGPDS